MRSRLRSLTDNGGELREHYLELTRAMWSALTEEERKQTKNLRAEDIERRRQSGWRAAVQALLALSKAKHAQSRTAG